MSLAKPTSSSSQVGTPTPRQRVLVVDDDINFGELTRRRLQRFGYEVKLHAAGVGTMNLLLKEVFDGVILDINMPGLSGPDVIDMIKSSGNRAIKVMFYSSMDLPALRAAAQKHAADSYLSKSASTRELELRVRDMLGVRTSQPCL